MKLGTLIAALLLLSAAAGCGGGAPSPSAELSSFVVKYVDENQHNCCELGMHATVSHITFARSDPRWAVVRIAVTDAAGKPDGVDFFVVRKNGSSWDVIGYGHGALGCSVPVRIRAELSVGVPDDILSCPDSG